METHKTKLTFVNNTVATMSRATIVRIYDDFVSYISVENFGPNQVSAPMDFEYYTGDGTPSDLWTSCIRIEGVGSFSVANSKCDLRSGDDSVRAEIHGSGFKYTLKIVPSSSSSREWEMPLIPW